MYAHTHVYISSLRMRVVPMWYVCALYVWVCVCVGFFSWNFLCGCVCVVCVCV